MQPSVVVDVGNTRIKWGRPARLLEMISLPHDDVVAWQAQFDAWRIAPASTWVLCGVHPCQRDKLRDWLQQRGQNVVILDSRRQIPVYVDVEHPDKVGLDRLLNAVAATGVKIPDEAYVIVDAGTAVTVDYVDVAGTFCGGAIFPGRRLMAKALHDYTALLPELESFAVVPGPARNTLSAMGSGITAAVAGGVERLFESYRAQTMGACRLYLTGGDAAQLAPLLSVSARVWPEMTLAGMLRSVATL